MKHSGIVVAIPLLAALLCSCSGKKKEVERFATDFAHKAQSGQMDSLKMIYPQIEDADSISINFVADSLKVDKTDKEGIYNVSYGNGVSAVVKLDNDGSLSVIETKGLFAYTKEKEGFAEKIGALEDDINDEEKAKRMAIVDLVAENIYEKYSNRRKNAIVNLGSTITEDITYMFETGSGYYTLKNTTDEPIHGNEYTITWTDSHIGMDGDRTSYRTEHGKDIPANGTVRIPYDFSGHDFTEISNIAMRELSNQEFMATYTPIGNEYEAYVKKHGDSVKNISKKLDDGPYHIKGKLGGKYAVHITLEKGMTNGSYYYDKYGPSAKLELRCRTSIQRPENSFLRNTMKRDTSPAPSPEPSQTPNT